MFHSFCFHKTISYVLKNLFAVSFFEDILAANSSTSNYIFRSFTTSINLLKNYLVSQVPHILMFCTKGRLESICLLKQNYKKLHLEHFTVNVVSKLKSITYLLISSEISFLFGCRLLLRNYFIKFNILRGSRPKANSTIFPIAGETN